MAKRSFSFMLDEELRAKAERIAKVMDRSLGWLVTLALEEKVAAIDAAHPPAPTRPGAPASPSRSLRVCRQPEFVRDHPLRPWRRARVWMRLELERFDVRRLSRVRRRFPSEQIALRRFGHRLAKPMALLNALSRCLELLVSKAMANKCAMR